jgi:hypothetical protein
MYTPPPAAGILADQLTYLSRAASSILNSRQRSARFFGPITSGRGGGLCLLKVSLA